jgi:hypothetical protein
MRLTRNGTDILLFHNKIASLLLAIYDANVQFLYINAGSPGTGGDAGSWSRTDLWKQIQERLLDSVKINLVADGQARDIYPFLVADSAFLLGKHIMNIFRAYNKGHDYHPF